MLSVAPKPAPPQTGAANIAWITDDNAALFVDYFREKAARGTWPASHWAELLRRFTRASLPGSPYAGMAWVWELMRVCKGAMRHA